jgi:hypothetical protein
VPAGRPCGTVARSRPPARGYPAPGETTTARGSKVGEQQDRDYPLREEAPNLDPVASTEPSWSPAGVTVSALVVVIACLLLGRWQLGRVYRPVEGYAAEPAAVPLARLVPEHSAVPAGDVARQVTVTGVYDTARQTAEPGHLLGGRPVYWVVTPLTVAGSAELPVVRGWVTQPGQSLATPPAGRVTVTARLELGSARSGASGLTDGWLTSGYLVRTAQSPPDPLSLQPVPLPPPADRAPDEFHLQNAIYVTQWWLLALFMVGFWWRLVRLRPGGEPTAAPKARADERAEPVRPGPPGSAPGPGRP